ncbi:MAG: lactate racemase domain-containing protein [Candidatus Bathyarchaeia archaeon]
MEDVTKAVKITTKAWYGDEPLILTFPETWDVNVCKMLGHDRPPVSDQEIRDALTHPIESKPISELARDKEEAVILIDDCTRPTPTHRVAPFVLEELEKGGISGDHVRFIGAVGTHRAMTREDFEKKLGHEIVKEYACYTHNCFDDSYESFLVNVGKTSMGTPVLVNKEYWQSDLKIGIGALKPHGSAGFGGGAKIVLPGCMGIESVYHNHGIVGRTRPWGLLHQTCTLGRVMDNRMRLDMEEAARIARLDIKVDLILNNRREVVGVFAGDFVAEHREGVKFAKDHYKTAPVRNADIVVLNTYPQEDEAGISWWAARRSVKKGGSVVSIVQCPEGQVVHYSVGRWGTDYGGKLFNPSRVTTSPVPKAGRVFIFSEYPQRTPSLPQPSEPLIAWRESWEEIIEELQEIHGEEAKVAMYPSTSIQYPPVPPAWLP